MKFTNIGDSEEITWIQEVVGRGSRRAPAMNAKATAEELIKHTYRDGWSLPPMPA
jgi:hypothetical protein